jgi:hypothetical protein
VHVNAQRRKKLIRSLDHDGQTVVTKDRKAKLAIEFYEQILGSPSVHSNSINLDILDLRCANMPELCERFTEEEVWNVIRSLPQNKASGPDGFTAHFLQATWPVIRADLMLVLEAFWHMDARDLHSVNKALMSLLPKSQAVTCLKDYRPISLIHCMGKLIFKILANRLASRLQELIDLG